MKKQQRLLNLCQLCHDVLSWQLKVFKLSFAGTKRDYIPLIHKLRKVTVRGPKAFIDYIKKLRTSLILHLSEEYPAKFVEGVSVTHDGIPKALGPAIDLIRAKSPAAMRLVLTILYSTRSLVIPGEPDVSTIETPFLGKGLIPIGKHVRSFWKTLGYKARGSVPRSVRFKKYHFTTKAGPQGQAIWSSWTDYLNLTELDKKHLINIGGEKIRITFEFFDTCRSWISNFLPNLGPVQRKLSYFPDKEGKVRVVAIGDYFTQSVLKPLHKFLFRVMRKIPQDCTFNQGSFVEKIKDWDEFYSIDLTAATDRFPISLESDLLKGYFPEEFVNSWVYLMVGKPFRYTDTKRNSRDVYYAVGNPMGFYSSWNSFALTHHYVMYYCCMELNIPWRKSKYVILGDDVLIGDRRIAMMYKDVLTDLGVEFSPLKTHESKTLCEFAKRYVWKGEEITPFPISSLKESSKRFYLLVNLMIDEVRKGWECLEGIPETVVSLHRLVIGNFRKNIRNKKFLEKIYKRSCVSEVVIKMTRNQITARDALESISRLYFDSLRPIELIYKDGGSAEGVLSSLAVEAFADSQTKFTKGRGRPLGDLATNLTMYLTSCEDETIFGQVVENLHRIPILYLHGMVSENYLDIQRGAFKIDTEGGGDWPFLLRSMALPLDDKVYVERQSHLISRASAVIGDKIHERLNLILMIYGSMY